MAMNSDNMGDEILAAVDALSSSDKTDRQKIFRAMAGAIVTHITTNADIDLTVLFTLGVPAPTDGGAALQTAWKAAGPQTGSVS